MKTDIGELLTKPCGTFTAADKDRLAELVAALQRLQQTRHAERRAERGPFGGPVRAA